MDSGWPQLPLNLHDSDYIVVEEVFPTTEWDDATWILSSAFIIFTMQSGFGLLEAGSVSQKNEVNIMVKNAVDVLFGGLSYWMFGYGLSFGSSKGSNKVVGVRYFFVDSSTNTNKDDAGHLFVSFFFQASFATTSSTIVSGAMVERTKLESYILFSFVNTVLYSIPSGWMWSDNGWLREKGAVDVAGAGCIHLVGGITGLVATLMLKPRTGRFTTNKSISPMGSPTNAIFGVFMLWWGWLGFNCGSTYGITNTKWILAARSAAATITASIAGGMTGITLSYILKRRKFDVSFLINGILGSLVAITAMCALAKPWQGVVIGCVGAIIACLGGPLCEKLKIDDPVGVVPVHGMAAIWSLLAVGIFGEHDDLNADIIKYDGLIAGGKDGFKLLGIQLLAIVVITAWTAATAFVTLKILDITIGLRVPLHEEILGADLVEHSLNGTYDKETREWRDREGHLKMIVKQYENETSWNFINRIHSQANIICSQCEQTGDRGGKRRSAFGFTRSDDSMYPSYESSDVLLQLTEQEKKDTGTIADTPVANETDHNSNKKRRRSHSTLVRKINKTLNRDVYKTSGSYNVNSTPAHTTSSNQTSSITMAEL